MALEVECMGLLYKPKMCFECHSLHLNGTHAVSTNIINSDFPILPILVVLLFYTINILKK